MKQRIQLFVLVFFSFALLPVASFAADEPPAVAAYLDAMKRQAKGYNRPTYGAIEPDRQGGAVLTDLKWSMTQPEVSVSGTFGKMTLSGMSQRASGSYSFKSVLIENTVIAMNLPDVGPVKITMPSFPSTNVHILPEHPIDGVDYTALVGSTVYETALIPLITVTVAGQSFDAKNMVINWSGDPETGLGKLDFSLESAVVPVSAIPNPKFQKDMKEEFDIEKLELGFDGSASIVGKNAGLNIAYAFRLAAKKIGHFEFAVAGQDIPGKLIGLLKELQNGGEPPKMGKLMPLMMGIKFAKLKMRFVDDNFTVKFLEFAAKKQGTTVEAMTSNGAALVQVSLMQLNLPEFSQKVVAAYNAFVKNPQNITIEASPSAPVALATLMGLMAAPSEAIRTLGVKVEANK